MNICIISPRYPYKNSTESVFVEQLVIQWAKAGHHCYVIAPFSFATYLRGQCRYGTKYEKRYIDCGNSIEIFKPRCLLGIRGDFLGFSLSSYEASKAIEKQIKKINVNFDFLYCHFFLQGLRAFRIARNMRIPLFVATGESTIPFLCKPFKSFSLEDFRNYTSGIVCVSKKNMKEALELGYATEEKCKVFPNAVNTSVFCKHDKFEARDTLGFPHNVFLIICVGDFSHRKGQQRILDAIYQLNSKGKVKVIFIGKGKERFKDDSIVFQGEVEHNKLPQYLSCADLFVLPTLREGCSNAIIEAMACGLPIVSSKKDFNSDILDESFSKLVDPMNVEEISKAISYYIDNEEKRKYDADMSYTQAQKLSIEKRAYNILSFIQEKINNADS